MTFRLVNRVRMSLSGTAGTGALTLNTAAVGFQSFSAAGMLDGDSTPYLIEDGSPVGSAWEIGQGTYHSNGTFTRDTITQSSLGGATAISVTSSAILSGTLRAQDAAAVPPASPSVVQYVNLQEVGGAGVDLTLPAAPTPGNHLLFIARGGSGVYMYNADWQQFAASGDNYSFGFGFRAVRSGDTAGPYTLGSPSASVVTDAIVIEVANFDPQSFGVAQVHQEHVGTTNLGSSTDPGIGTLGTVGNLLIVFAAGDAVTLHVNSPTMTYNITSTGMAYNSTQAFGHAVTTNEWGDFNAYVGSGTVNALVLNLSGAA